MALGLWWTIFLKKKGWLALIGLLGCLGVVLFGVGSYRTAASFEARGVMVDVQVTDLRMTTSRTDGTTRTTYFATLRYEVGGQPVVREVSIIAPEYARFQENPRQQMRVLPDAPDQIETTPGEAQAGLGEIIGAGVLLGGVTLGLGGWIGRAAALAMRSRRFGTKAAAQVTAVKHKWLTDGLMTRNWQLVWRLDDGSVGRSLGRPLAQLQAWPVGSRIEVYLYRGRSFWAGDVGGQETVASG